MFSLSRFFETTTVCKPYNKGNFTFRDIDDEEGSDLGGDVADDGKSILRI